jgi:HSP20 family molecular chaperone IbpA
MTNLARYAAADLPALLERINRNSIGMDEYFDRLFRLHETTTNYPPYNLVTVSNVESRLELALAGFKKAEVNVYTQDGKLFVEGQKEDKETETEYYSGKNCPRAPPKEGLSLNFNNCFRFLLRLIQSFVS